MPDYELHWWKSWLEHARSRPQNTEENHMCWTCTISPWVWCSCIWNSIKIKLWQGQQNAEPGIKDNYWCSQIHTNPVNGCNDKPGESRKQKKRQSTFASCEIQEAWKPSSAQMNAWAHKMQVKENQLSSRCTQTWTVRACEQKDHITLFTASLEKRTVPEIQDSIHGIHPKGTQTKEERKAATLDFMQQTYPQDHWTHAYTHGSAEEAAKNGGGGLYVFLNNGTAIQQATPMGKFSTNIRLRKMHLKQ